MGRIAFSWLLFACLGTTSVSAQVLFEEDFDSYSPSDLISVVGAGNGWETWGLDPSVDAVLLDIFAQSGANSLFVENNQDVVQVWDGEIISGRWIVKGSVYVEGTQDGDAYWIMLNTFSQPAGPFNWSVQLLFNAAAGTVSDQGGSAGGPPVGGTLPLITDTWVEILVDIDLDNNLHSIFYGGTALRECELWSGSGNIALECLDLFAAGSLTNGIYFDDISVEEVTSGACDSPTALTCSSVGCMPGPGDVELTWVNGSTYVDLEVSRDGLLIATLPGTDTSYTDPAVPAGAHSYSVRGICAVGASCPTTCGPFAHCPGPLPNSIVMLNWDTNNTWVADAVNTWATDNGWTVTQVFDGGEMQAALTSAFIYEVVVYENPCCPTVGEDAALIDYVANDGKVLFGFWNLDGSPALQSTFGISSATDFFAPERVFSWDSTHPIFAGPMAITSPLDILGPDAWLDNGDRSEPSADGIAIGGFLSDTPAFGEAAIIVANENRTVANTFTPDDMAATIVDLIYNEMDFLVNGGGSGPMFVRGDTNDDGGVDISDAVYALSALFVSGSPPPPCLDAADANDDGTVDISDAVFQLSALFVSGSPTPPAPNPGCGEDPTPDTSAAGMDLGCEIYDNCP